MANVTQAPSSPSSAGPTRRNPAIVAWMRLARIARKVDQRTSDVLQPHGLTVGRFDVLNHAGVREGRNQQELAAALLVTKGNICQMLDALEADGLLVRHRHGRAKQVRLTDRGRVLRCDALAAQEQHLSEIFNVLSAREIDTLGTILRKLDQSLSPSTAKPGEQS